MNWNQFRKAHKGLSKEEMSSLWKKYKAGEYEVESDVAATNDEIRDIDPNHGHDLDYIKEVENEIKREEKEQKFLNRLNNKEYSVALRDFTHW